MAWLSRSGDYLRRVVAWLSREALLSGGGGDIYIGVWRGG